MNEADLKTYREMMNDPLASFDAFVSSVRARLEAGRAQYGDRSFSRPPAELIGELQQEALDLCGWGYVLWCRLEAMRVAGEARWRLAGAEREQALAALDALRKRVAGVEIG